VRGQAHGFIRTKQGREIFFHRADVPEGMFNSLEEGDEMAFELVEDAVSGARALHVTRARRAKR
jgi:cold shock CspA family protein